MNPKTLSAIAALLSVFAMSLLFFSGPHRQGPKEIRVVCKTTKGRLTLTVVPAWSPLGSARFL